jgi:hypothetical protein
MDCNKSFIRRLESAMMSTQHRLNAHSMCTAHTSVRVAVNPKFPPSQSNKRLRINKSACCAVHHGSYAGSYPALFSDPECKPVLLTTLLYMEVYHSALLYDEAKVTGARSGPVRTRENHWIRFQFYPTRCAVLRLKNRTDVACEGGQCLHT